MKKILIFLLIISGSFYSINPTFAETCPANMTEYDCEQILKAKNAESLEKQSQYWDAVNEAKADEIAEGIQNKQWEEYNKKMTQDNGGSSENLSDGKNLTGGSDDGGSSKNGDGKKTGTINTELAKEDYMFSTGFMRLSTDKTKENLEGKEGENLSSKEKLNRGLGFFIQKLMLGLTILSMVLISAGAGFMIVSTGDDQRLSAGKNMIKAGIFGLIVALLSYPIINLLRYILYK